MRLAPPAPPEQTLKKLRTLVREYRESGELMATGGRPQPMLAFNWSGLLALVPVLLLAIFPTNSKLREIASTLIELIRGAFSEVTGSDA